VKYGRHSRIRPDFAFDEENEFREVLGLARSLIHSTAEVGMKFMQILYPRYYD
jgi:hypothetical protein